MTGPSKRPPGRRSAARGPMLLAGAVAGAAGLAVSHAVTALLSLRATPVVAVAETVIALTPGAIIEALIQAVGQADKPLLVGGVTTVAVALSAGAGLLSRRSPALAALVFVLMGALALVAAATRPGFGAATTVPIVAGTLTWAAVLALLLRTLHRPAETAATDRRGFLVAVAVVAATTAVVGGGGELLSRSRRGVAAARRALSLPVTEGTVPAGATFGVPEIAPWRTPNPEFYRIDTALVVPRIDPSAWRLRIHGMVEEEVELDYAALLDRGLVETWTTIACVSNEVGGDLIGNAWWSGVPVAGLLAEAGVLPGADAVLQTSADGWNCGTPLAALTDGRDAMVAVAMNGEPLPTEHGFPARMIVPGLYGYVSATKWLVDLEVTTFGLFDAFWTERGWSEQGPIKLQSRIDTPRSGEQVVAGRLAVGGYAWLQRIGIDAIEYRLDDGPWQAARLARVPGADTWVQWAAEVQVAAGEHVLAVRATDANGLLQTEVRQDVVPDGATGWHRVSFTAAPA